MARIDAIARPLTGAGLVPVAALVLSLPAALASSSVFAFGFWERAEPVVAYVHAAAAVAAAALAVTAIAEPRRAVGLLHRPLALIPALIALWSALMAPLVAYPLLSVFGAPQSGYGVLWYADLALLTACASAFALQRSAWRIVSGVAIGVALTVAALKAWQAYSGQAMLIPVSAFYAYPAIALPVIVLPLRSIPWSVAALSAALVLLAASASLTAWIFAAIALVYFGLSSLPTLRRRIESRTISVVTILIAALAPYALVRWIELIQRFTSVHSRNLLLRVMEQAQSGDALAFLTGHGWGRTQDALAAHLNASGEVLWQANWDYLWRDFFHSHNWLTESLFAAGVPGAALLLALIVAPPLVCRPSHRRYATAFAICVAGLDGFWIELPFWLPFLALAYAALSDGPSNAPAPRWVGARIGLCSIAAAGLLVAAVALVQFGTAVTEVRRQLATNPPAAITRSFPRSPAGDGLAMAESLRTALAQIAGVTDPNARAAYRPQIEWIASQLHDSLPATRTVLLPMTGLSLMAMLYVSNELAWARDAVPDSDSVWRQWLMRLLELAPDRSDAAIPYLSYLLAQNRLAAIDEMVGRLRRHQMDDPVALYFAGAVMTADPRPEVKRVGLNMIGQSIRNGIERYMPVPDWLKQAATLH